MFPFQDEHEKLTLFSFHAPGVLIKSQRERLSSIESLVCLGETNPESLLYIREEEINSDAGGIQLGADWPGFLVHGTYFFVIKVILVSHHKATSYDRACGEFLSLCPHLPLSDCLLCNVGKRPPPSIDLPTALGHSPYLSWPTCIAWGALGKRLYSVRICW